MHSSSPFVCLFVCLLSIYLLDGLFGFLVVFISRSGPRPKEATPNPDDGRSTLATCCSPLAVTVHQVELTVDFEVTSVSCADRFFRF